MAIWLCLSLIHIFPITIVRPSQTYGYDRIPLSVKGKSCWSVVERILNDQPVIVHGDGKSTWHCTHTFDFADNFIQLINNEKTIGQAYHNINPRFVTWDMIYHELYRLLNKQPHIVHIPSAVSYTHLLRLLALKELKFILMEKKSFQLYQHKEQRLCLQIYC